MTQILQILSHFVEKPLIFLCPSAILIKYDFIDVKGGFVMSRKCDICGKGTATGMQVSHSHIRNKKTWKPNIQKVRVVVDGTPKKLNVCTRCLRSNKVQRAK